MHLSITFCLPCLTIPLFTLCVMWSALADPEVPTEQNHFYDMFAMALFRKKNFDDMLHPNSKLGT